VLTSNGWQWDDPQLFDKTARQNLPSEQYGSFHCGEDTYILEAAEEAGYDWPYSCQAGVCTNCAAILVDGEVTMEVQQILADPEVEEQNIRLTCISRPTTENVNIIYRSSR